MLQPMQTQMLETTEAIALQTESWATVATARKAAMGLSAQTLAAAQGSGVNRRLATRLVHRSQP